MQACMSRQLRSQHFLKTLCGQTIGVGIDQQVFGNSRVWHGWLFWVRPRGLITNLVRHFPKMVRFQCEFLILMHVKFDGVGMLCAETLEGLFQRVVILTFSKHPFKEKT